jgi:hypothetical protein
LWLGPAIIFLMTGKPRGDQYLAGIAAIIPACPDGVYAKKGWAGWGDWLGTRRSR